MVGVESKNLSTHNVTQERGLSRECWLANVCIPKNSGGPCRFKQANKKAVVPSSKKKFPGNKCSEEMDPGKRENREELICVGTDLLT